MKAWILSFGVLLVLSTACGDDDDSKPAGTGGGAGSNGQSGASGSTSGDGGQAGQTTGQLGPECTAYFAPGGCCLALSAGDAKAQSECDTTEHQYSTEDNPLSYEPTCKKQNDAGKTAGLCH